MERNIVYCVHIYVSLRQIFYFYHVGNLQTILYNLQAFYT